ncbi:MAG: tetratricopeptide repeat protein, partial [Candidatus Poribacteria bacterium]|nr:tetratricopeptide repeat protein [Candidatus Poribacteria bacterium]
MNKPLKVFITYARTDKVAKDKLIKALAVMTRSGLIDLWHDTEMLGGDRWQQEIFSKHLPTSDLLLYLVSIDSLASENCYEEFEVALEKKIRVIPIIFADCDWKSDQQLSNFQVFPDDGTPINEWVPETKGWQNSVKGIRKTVENMLSQSETASGVSEEDIEAEVVFQHGNLLLKLGKIDMAIAAYSEAIKYKPDYAEAYVNRGGVYNEKGEFNKAIADLNKAIQLNPELAEAYVNRGNAYSSKDDFQNALENYNMAIELKPDLAETYVNRGNFYSHKGDFQNALENYNMAIELKPD